VKKPILAIVLALFNAAVSHARETGVSPFESTIEEFNLSRATYCYRNANEEIQGNDLHTPKKIASLTKIFTTFLAAEYYRLDHRFKTQFHFVQAYNGDKLNSYLFISGDLDPSINKEHLQKLSAEIKEYGPLQKVFFDSKFIAYVKTPHDDPLVSPSLMSSGGTNLALVAALQIPVQRSPNGLSSFIKDLQSEGYETSTRTITNTSHTVRELLKIMNTQSDNMIAEILFRSIPEQTRAEIFTRYEFNPAEIKLKNGSGFPIGEGKGRWDNKASCGSLLKSLDLLSGGLQNKGMSVNEVFQQPMDQGTLKKYGFAEFPSIHDSLVAKTGYTKLARTLAGWTDITHQTSFVFLIPTGSRTASANAKTAMVDLIQNLYSSTTPNPICTVENPSCYPADFFSFKNEDVVERIEPLPIQLLQVKAP
jgi:D-alanyl-D-alanine carboxypeptidase/D-alanyl-D-alanine-endopeptidase (penicillin-binding protein 4)